MSNFKFTLDKNGVRELLKSKEIEEEVKKYADKAVKSLGEGYRSDTFVGRNRVNASVYAETYEARKENKKNNTILKAVIR